jgi:hypothetical protein
MAAKEAVARLENELRPSVGARAHKIGAAKGRHSETPAKLLRGLGLTLRRFSERALSKNENRAVLLSAEVAMLVQPFDCRFILRKRR